MNLKKNSLCFFAFIWATLFWGPVTYAITLPELIASALDTHPSVRAQRAMTRAADDAISAARWQFFPTPSVAVEQVSASATDINYRYGDNRVTTLRIQQPLWSGGRLTAGLNKAQAGRLVSESEMEAVRQDLAVRVVQGYVEWYGGRLKSIALRASLRTLEQLKAQIERRIGQGISPESDRTLVVSRIDQVQVEIISAHAQEGIALSKLSQLVSRRLQEDELTTSTSLPKALGASEVLLERAQSSSPYVLKLIASASIQEADIQERKADLQPEVFLRAERQFGSYSYRNAAPENRVFVGVSTRFGAGLSSQSQISGSQARLDAALSEIENTRVNLGQQILADYLQFESGAKRLTSLNDVRQSSSKISLAWERQFLSGTKSWLDVMNAARELTQVDIQLAEVQASQTLLEWKLSIMAQGVESVINPSQIAVK